MRAQDTLRELGWSHVLDALSARCRLPAGRRAALSLPFLPDAGAVREALLRVEEARSLSEAGLSLPFAGVGEVEEHLTRVGKGGVLEPLALRECAALVRASARTRTVLEARAAELPRLWALAEPITADADLADRIERAIEPSGAISDRASPALAAARERGRGLHRALKAQVEAVLDDPEMQRHLRDRYFTIRNERYVVPVLASDSRPGPGHRPQRLAVRPDPVRRARLDGGAGERALHRQRHGGRGGAADPAGALGGARLRQRGAGPGPRSRWRSSTWPRPRRCSPRIWTPTRRRWPRPAVGSSCSPSATRILVLQGKKVVASHVRLEPPHRALIVSGPNGGGKTVAITAVGVSALMLRAGLPVPAAAGSRLPFYLEVNAAVDERGDMAKDLSTFTAHLTSVKDMLAGAVPGSLVLVDEIAADTDPREGAALAAAILESLVEKGAAVLVTTHLDELKALALVDPRLRQRTGRLRRREADPHLPGAPWYAG